MHPGTSYIYLGFYDGTVEFMNVDSGGVSVYKVKAQDVGLESDSSKGYASNRRKNLFIKLTQTLVLMQISRE